MQAKVQRIVDEALAVGTGIQHDRQHTGRINSGRGGVDHQLPDRNADAVGPPVPDAQDCFRIGHDNQVDVPSFRGIFDGRFQVFRTVCRKIGGILRRDEEPSLAASPGPCFHTGNSTERVTGPPQGLPPPQVLGKDKNARSRRAFFYFLQTGAPIPPEPCSAPITTQCRKRTGGPSISLANGWEAESELMQPGLCRKIKAKDDGKEKTTWQKS